MTTERLHIDQNILVFSYVDQILIVQDNDL